MTFLELARSRRSIRSYEPRAIPREDLEKCVEAARLAPSACNSQPWKYIIIDDPQTRSKFLKKVFAPPFQLNAFADNASAFAVIVSEKTKFPAWMGSKLRRTDFRKIDLGISCAHFVLEARDLGIGTCILGWFNENWIKKTIKIPFSKKIELVISMGYPRDKELREKMVKPSSETVGYNEY